MTGAPGGHRGQRQAQGAFGVDTAGRKGACGACLAMARVACARGGVLALGAEPKGGSGGGRRGPQMRRCRHRARTDNKLGEEGGAAIAEALKVNRTVHTLNLGGAQCTATAACSGRGLQ